MLQQPFEPLDDILDKIEVQQPLNPQVKAQYALGYSTDHLKLGFDRTFCSCLPVCSDYKGCDCNNECGSNLNYKP